MTDDKLINAYHTAMGNYEAAKAGTGNRVETFTKFLVAERALSARLGWVVYGDEIGMGDDLSLPERDCARTPMQWSTEPHGGFTKSGTPVMPVISGGPYGFEQVNVAQQRRDPNSQLNWIERIIRMRKEVPEIGWGSFTVLPSGTPEVLVLRYDWRNNAVLVIHNLAPMPLEIRLDLKSDTAQEGNLINLLAENHSYADNRGRHHIVLEPYGYRWYRIGGLDYLLKRAEI